ncbi:SRPBCC domain-containing protein [Stenomitos frigidus]|uniref:Polyketide cyclase n=1 Tax=Stenomitos frigidus ULC18 TaxID=2107698 RepID=A0A2T1DYM9_9CYAN|nr:SRPBCC domain-containing protein [Stenomitos frigidus]PSB25617.1 polyketide cyclase [Stenomitos frigidus ULC18]
MNPTTNDVATRSLDQELVITRVFDAPRSLLFKVWTEREHLMHWCAPRNFTIPFAEADFRPGGAWRTCLRSPEGKDYWVQGIYREIVEPERLVFTHAWEDEDGKSGHTTIVTVTFTDRDAKTTLTFHQALFESVEGRDAHRSGWSECLDCLEAYLATVD